MSPTVKLLQDSALIFGRSVREARRQAALAFFAPTFLSVAIVLIFEAVYGSIADVPGFPTEEFIAWVAPGAVFLSVFLGAGFTAGSVVRDARSGYLDRLRLLPTRPSALMIGRLAFDAVRALPPAAAVLGVALGLGATNQGGVAGFVGLLGLSAALAVAWNGIFYLAALRTLNPAVIQGLQPIFMPVVMFSTFWVPTAFMPGWYEDIASRNPFTSLVDAGRSVLLGTADWESIRISLVVLAILGAGTYLLVTKRFTAMVRAD
jgi:ABC-2 type transport system permease protein